LLSGIVTVGAGENTILLERVSTVVPFPRGLTMVDGDLYTIARGRVRGAGGVSAAVNDRAGTLFAIDPDIAEPFDAPEVSAAVRLNGRVIAEPASPPFQLWDRSASPPQKDRLTDRPYCTLRYHEPTKSFYLCAFSGVDLPRSAVGIAFSKNLTDALIRYDLRTQSWHEVERHSIGAGGNYPHHDVTVNPPPHGWLNGPDNCLIVQNTLYAVAKDNNLLVRYDLSRYIDDPDAPPPPGVLVLDEQVRLRNGAVETYFGHSALAHWRDHLYVACRTSSTIFRIPIDRLGRPVEPVAAEVVARFDPYDPVSQRSANLTDMDFDSKGRLYVISAKPAKVYRFKPDPNRVFDARNPANTPWLDAAAITNNPKMKCENVFVDDRDRVFLTSGDGHAFQNGAHGTIYRVIEE
jgi:hypothetical protein